LTEEKEKDIAATNQLLEVIRGDKASLELETPEPEESPDETPDQAVYQQKEHKGHQALSPFARRTVGLDVGSHTVKCVFLQKKGFNRVELVHAEAVRISVTEKQREKEGGTNAQVRAIREAMQGIPSHRAKVVTSVGGVSTAIRQIELPKMSAKELSSSVSLWARNYMPFDIKEVQLDYQVFGFDRSTRKIRLLLVAVIKDYIQQHIELLHEASIDPVLVDVNPLAVMNAIIFNEEIEDDQCTIVLDVGDRNSTLCIYSETAQYFVRNLMISGDDFTRDIQRKLTLPYGDVEHYKRGEMAPVKTAETSTNLIDVIRPSMDALIKEVRRSLTYYENQTKRSGFSQIVLTGGSVQMEGFADYLGESLGLPVKVFDPFKHIDTRDFSLPGPPSQFALAVGLALREHK
jgi:type IV pilus assembly protein PilM